MNYLGKFIREERKKLKLTQEEFAKNAKISAASLRAIEGEEQTNFTTETIDKLALSLGMLSHELYYRASSGDLEGRFRRRIPIIGYANSKRQIKNVHEDLFTKEHKKIIGELATIEELDDTSAYALFIKDDSMEPIKNDWIAIISPKLKLEDNQPVAAIIDEKFYVRNLKIIDDKKFVLTGTKSNIEPIEMEKGQHELVHRVWGFRSPASYF